MSRVFLIPSFLSNLLFFSVIFIFWYFGFAIFFIYFSLLLFLFYFFRKYKVVQTENISSYSEVLLAPVHGKVESIRKNLYSNDEAKNGLEIRISISMVSEKGLYLPLSGEALYLKSNKGKKIDKKSAEHFFYGDLDDVSHTDLILKSRNNFKYLLRFVDAPYSLKPVIWLKSGDRGRVSSCFGYYPMGGTLIIFVPIEAEVLIFEGEMIKPGQSVLTIIKDNSIGTNYVI